MSIVTEELGEATGYEALAPTAKTGITASLITPATGSGSWANVDAQAALITVETEPIRFTIDGTTVEATVGHRMDAGQSYVVLGSVNVKKFSCIDISSASSVKITVFHKP